MVKNNHIVTQTWGVLVTHMYFPIEVSFSLPTGEEDMDVETGHELALKKAHEIFDENMCIDVNMKEEYQYTFDLELEY